MNILFLILMNVSFLMCAIPEQELFLQAQQAVKEQKFDKALEHYQAIKHKSFPVWFNMAMIVKNDDPAQALHYLYQAKRFATWNTYNDVMRAIKELKPSEATWVSTVYEFLEKFSTLFSLMGWQLLVIVLIIFLFLAYVYHAYLIMIILGILIAGISSLMIIKKQLIEREKSIVRETTTVFIGPSEQFSQRTTLQPLAEVTILKQEHNWYKVRYNGYVGWIPAEKLPRFE